MRSVLDRPVLQLNHYWQVIDEKTVAQAVTMMMSENAKFPGLPVALGMAKGEDGEFTPLPWDEWIKLDPLDEDYTIRLTRGRLMRAPTAVMAVNSRKPCLVRPHFSNDNVYKRDKGICAYSGVKLRREDASTDHVYPKGRGGAARDWRNVVTCHKDINLRKGCRTPEEAGLKLLYQPKEPALVPKEVLLKGWHPDWEKFLVK